MHSIKSHNGVDIRSEIQAPQSTLGVVALDPGVRTFQTTFNLNSIVTEWGKGDYTRIGRLCHAYDKLQSKWSQVTHNKRYKSHYRFKERLLYKSREFPWCHVYIVNEVYTSKTCTHCGHIHRH